MIFECRTVEIMRLGKVALRGAEWREPRVFIEEAMCNLGLWCWYAGAAIAFFGCIFGALLRVDVIAEQGLILGALIFALGFVLIWFGARFPAKRRVLLFGSEGLIHVPHGIDGGWVRSNNEGHEFIMNIEAVPKKGLRSDSKTEYTHCVRLLMERGKAIRIANNLEEDQARRVVATLVQALNTIRSEIEVEVGDFVDIT